VGGRDGGRGHQNNLQRKISAAFSHKPDTVHTGHIGDLVGVGRDRRNAARHDCGGILGGKTEAALDVDVRVDQTRRHECALQVYFLMTRLARADAGNAISAKGYIGLFDIP